MFFSHAGENYNVGHIEKGNTHIIVDVIADETGAGRAYHMDDTVIKNKTPENLSAQTPRRKRLTHEDSFPYRKNNTFP